MASRWLTRVAVTVAIVGATTIAGASAVWAADIPIELLAKILQRLARRGLLTSHQGTRGGYSVARPATVISVADVIQAVDGPLTVTACSVHDQGCGQYSKCNVRDPLWRIKDRILTSLAACSLDEIATDVPMTSAGPELQPVTLSRRARE